MNANDCDSIGYVLAEHEALEFVRKQFYALDARIEARYEAYRKVFERDNQVMATYLSRLVERFGTEWCVRRACTSDIQRELFEEVSKEIYGEDYCPSLFQQGRGHDN